MANLQNRTTGAFAAPTLPALRKRNVSAADFRPAMSRLSTPSFLTSNPVIPAKAGIQKSARAAWVSPPRVRRQDVDTTYIRI